MKGKPESAGEWADALEDEAIAEAAKEGGTVEDIREAHARLITELFEEHADADSVTAEIAKSLREDMMKALKRVDVLADVREKEVEAPQEADEPLLPSEALVEDLEEKELAQGKFKDAPKEMAA